MVRAKLKIATGKRQNARCLGLDAPETGCQPNTSTGLPSATRLSASQVTVQRRVVTSSASVRRASRNSPGSSAIPAR